jgi:hypothetical protein
MRNANAQREDTMIRAAGLRQALTPHVSYAETAANRSPRHCGFGFEGRLKNCDSAAGALRSSL